MKIAHPFILNGREVEILNVRGAQILSAEYIDTGKALNWNELHQLEEKYYYKLIGNSRKPPSDW